MEKQPINLLQIAIIFFGGIGILNHVLVVPLVLDASLRDAWISILFSAIVYFIWLPLVYYIYRKTNGQRIIDWIKKNYSKSTAYFILVLMIIYIISMGFITIKDTLTFITFYSPQTPKIVFVLMFLIVCLYNIYSGIRSVAITSAVLIPFVFLFGFFVMTTNFQYKDFTLLQPILENGLKPVLKGMIYPAVGFAEILLILFFQHHIPTKIKWYHLYLIAIVLIILTLSPTIGAIVEFGPVVSSLQRYPAFEQWRIVSIGKYIEHMDFLSIYQWFVGTFIRLSMLGVLLFELIPIHSRKVKKIVIFLLGLLIFNGIYLPLNDATTYFILFNYFFLAAFVLLMIIFIILWVLALFSSKNKGLSS